MEFDFLGERCSVSECRRHDYLPFKCGHCSAKFCSEHAARAKHRCASLGLEAPDEALPCRQCGEVIAWVSRSSSAAECAALRDRHAQTCSRARVDASLSAHASCSARLAAPVACTRCSVAHCVKHRTPAAHSCPFADAEQPLVRCPPAISKRERHPAAAPTSVGYENSSVRPQGDRRIEGPERIYVEVAFGAADGLAGRKRIYYFFSKRWTAGRALDAIAAHAKIAIRAQDGRRLRLRVGDVVCDTLDRLGDCLPQHSVVTLEYEALIQPRSANANALESGVLCMNLNGTFSLLLMIAALCVAVRPSPLYSKYGWQRPLSFD